MPGGEFFPTRRDLSMRRVNGGSGHAHVAPHRADQTPIPALVIFHIGHWVIAIMLALYSVRDLLLLFFVGVVVAAALHPLVAFLERYRVPKGLAGALIYLAFIGTLGASAALVAPTLVSEATAFVAQAPTRCQEARTTLQSSDSGPLATLGKALPVPEEAMRFVSQLGSLVSSRTLVDVASVRLLTVLAVALYWTMDQARMERLWLSLAPSAKRPDGGCPPGSRHAAAACAGANAREWGRFRHGDWPGRGGPSN